jgi:hypothetical protein
MMQTPVGDSVYQGYMGLPTDFTDTVDIADGAYLRTMYEFMADWYAANGSHFCVATHAPEDTMCHNYHWEISNQSDDFLEGWQICDGTRRFVADCNTVGFDAIPLPEEASPTVSQSPLAGHRFNLNPNDNDPYINIPPQFRIYANYNSVELYVDENDAIIPQLISTTPPSGNRSIRLNNEQYWWHVSLMRRDFIVEASDPTYYFSYAFVMEDPNHGPTGNPFFRVVLKDDGCAVVDELCIIANVGNDEVEVANISGFAPIVYKQWTCDSFDLTPYIGESVTIEFIPTDCGAGAHFGYAHVADICDDCASMPHIALDTITPAGCGLPQFCGTLTFGEDYKFVDLQLDITQMGQILNSSSNYTYDDSTGVYCFDLLPSDTIGLGVGGFDVFGVARLINLNGDTISVRSLTAVLNTVDTVDNDFFLPVESCCPDSLTAAFTSQEFMPVFGGNDCDELIYYVEGTILIPNGYIYCDSLPVFDYAYIIYAILW